MSNTLNTPVEALELSYPIRVERYGLRRDSGGKGEHAGGDGVVRELRVLDDCRVSVISERRLRRPQGERGGGLAMPGRNRINGDDVPPKETRDLNAGDVVTIETPGGGGWGD
jgi:N-methylhydantoinase B